jgi:PAS domain S-box-containing protein
MREQGRGAGDFALCHRQPDNTVVGADDLTDDEMKLFSRWTNLSETTSKALNTRCWRQEPTPYNRFDAAIGTSSAPDRSEHWRGVNIAMSAKVESKTSLTAIPEGLAFFVESTPLLMGTVALMPGGDLFHLFDNAATCRFFGSEPGSTQHRSARAMGVPDELILLWRRQYEQSIQMQEPIRFEYNHPTLEGPRTLAVTVSPLNITSHEGRCCGYVAEDVTDRLTAERQLSASNNRFKAAVRAVEGVLWTNDAEGRMIGEQAGWSAITGQTQEEYEGYGWSQAVHPDDVEPTLKAWKSAVADRKPFVFEHRLRRHDGQWGHFSIRAIPVQGEDGGVREWVGVHTDIGEQREAERRLQKSEEQLRLATDAAEVGSWDVDPLSDTLYWPPRVKAMFGISPDASVSLTEDFFARLHPDDRDRVAAAYEAATAPERRAVYDVEYRTIGKDDRVVRWVAAKGRALFDGRGQCYRVIGTAVDITARKRAEQAAAEQARSLQVLNSTGAALAAELDLQNIVQLVTDAGVGITGAQFGAFFHNQFNDAAESYVLHALSGVDRSEFDKLEMPRNTPVFASTFTGQGVVRSDDITLDPRYGKNSPGRGMPQGHLPVRSYLAVPVISRSGEVIGELFFGHAERGVFSESTENLVKGMAGQAAVAIDNARLYAAAQREIAQRRKVEEQQLLLINELNHRVKNTLATVQSIVAQTSRQHISATEIREAIEGRLLPLAAAHDLLTRHNWEGADLRDIIERAVEPFMTDEARIVQTGPSVQLAPQASLAISMAIHELATNAVKYGALGAAGGIVEINWTADAGGFELEWRERGGPKVTSPTSRGFGSRLLERGLASDLGGEVRLDFRPDGLVCRITALLDAKATDNLTRAAPKLALPSPSIMPPRRRPPTPGGPGPAGF